MKVLLTLYGDETMERDSSPEEVGRVMAAWAEFGEAARAAGVLLACEGLEGSATATTVRVHGGRRHITDGPFIETKEQLGGFILVDVPDLNAAIQVAARIPLAKYGAIEVRPIAKVERMAS
jgi:hypothetical protein